MEKIYGCGTLDLVIDPDGRISAILRQVKPADHVEQLLGALTAAPKR